MEYERAFRLQLAQRVAQGVMRVRALTPCLDSITAFVKRVRPVRLHACSTQSALPSLKSVAVRRLLSRPHQACSSLPSLQRRSALIPAACQCGRCAVSELQVCARMALLMKQTTSAFLQTSGIDTPETTTLPSSTIPGAQGTL